MREPAVFSRRSRRWPCPAGDHVPLAGVNVSAFSLFGRFRPLTEAGPNKQIVLVLDGAGWHAAKNLAIPEGIHLVFLPPYSPELQPAEHLWPLVHEAMANRRIDTLDDLEDLLVRRCRKLTARAEQIRSQTFFNWWPLDYAA